MATALISVIAAKNPSECSCSCFQKTHTLNKKNVSKYFDSFYTTFLEPGCDSISIDDIRVHLPDNVSDIFHAFKTFPTITIRNHPELKWRDGRIHGVQWKKINSTYKNGI